MLHYLCLVVVVTAASAGVLHYGETAPAEVLRHGEAAPAGVIRFGETAPAADSYTEDNIANQQSAHGAEDDTVMEISRNKTKCRIYKHVTDCSKLGIINITELDIPPGTIVLDLSYNNIQFIQDEVFSKLTQLKWLDIAHNKIMQLNNKSFYNLALLESLNLVGNKLFMSKDAFPVDVFQPLVSLKSLRMNNNTQMNDTDLGYPDEALAYLTNLTTLYVDGLFNKTFGAGFQNMTSLTNLTLRGDKGYCNITSLPGDMFTSLTNLKHLVIRLCNINGSFVDSTTFLPLTNLITLDLSHNDALGFESLGNALSLIANQSEMRILKLSNINNPYSRGQCITNEFSASLPRSLESLDVTSNSLEILESDVLKNLPENLTDLYLNDNRFVFASYLKDFYKLQNLKYLEIASWNTFPLPMYYPANENKGVCCKTSGETYDPNSMLLQTLPPNVLTILIKNAGWSNDLTEFHFDPNNSVTSINLDWNNFPKLVGPITGLNRLENLSMVSCNIQEIHKSFFQNLTSLKYLDLGSNYFGNRLFKKGIFPFNALSHLIYLDLSFCDVQTIDPYAFWGLNKLEILLLQRNPFHEFDINLSNMTHLRYINFTRTLVTSLSPEMRGNLEKIHSLSNLTVDFAVDLLQCFCSDLDFIQWMTTTKVISKSDEYICSYQDGIQKHVMDLEKVYNGLKRECITNYQLFSIVISCTVLLVIVMLAAIVYHFRWKIWYLYYAALLHYRGDDNGKGSFDFDVFISYSHDDEHFVVNTLYPELQSRGLKVLLHAVHFIAGQYISSNIVNAVQNSKHTLVVLTKNLTNSKWSRFEIEMANNEQVHTGRSVLLFLIMEKIPRINTKILFHLKSNTYVKFPGLESRQDETIMELFWSKLVSDLKI